MLGYMLTSYSTSSTLISPISLVLGEESLSIATLHLTSNHHNMIVNYLELDKE